MKSSVAFTGTFAVTPGVVPDMAGKEPVEFFNVLFDDTIKRHVWQETTRYAEQYIEKNKHYLEDHPQARAHDWIRRPMVLKEVDALFAMVIAMGIVGFQH